MVAFSVRGLAWASLLFTTAVQAAPTSQNQNQTPSKLPVVDLGYQLQQAASYNETGKYYTFSNIRYAAAPLGDLRFRAPQPPPINRRTVQNGSAEARICPQASPAWSGAQSGAFVVSRLLNLPYTYTPLPPQTAVPQFDPRTSEDCLFLDVVVPQSVFARRNKKKVAVLVWIYGGGYTGGSKTVPASGLLERSKARDGDQDLVFVSLNYRLGAFGFLSGEEVKRKGNANAGLLDQRFALEWVQRNIHLFGGDAGKVTVIGESAGGGSIMHHITAYGGKKAPFRRAIAQSPGWDPAVSDQEQQDIYNSFLRYANVSSLKDLRKASTETLIAANYLQVANSPYGKFTYGPVTDGSYVPAQPAKLLEKGRFDKSVDVMVGHNTQEALAFTPPNITTNAEFDAWLTRNFETSKPAAIQYISKTLYLPVYDGTYGYKDVLGRAILATSEYVFVCNTFYLNEAYRNQTYAYVFNVPPGIHGQDVAYTFFTGNQGTPNAQYNPQNPYAITNVTVAVAMQKFFTSFAQYAKPIAIPGVPDFPLYGRSAKVEVLTDKTIYVGKDDAANSRCQWWQEQKYL